MRTGVIPILGNLNQSPHVSAVNWDPSDLLILPTRWGTAQLLANLGDALWIQAAGSEAAVAAVLSLKSLEAADEAPSWWSWGWGKSVGISMKDGDWWVNYELLLTMVNDIR